jgi:hypothetical protein
LTRVDFRRGGLRVLSVLRRSLDLREEGRRRVLRRLRALRGFGVSRRRNRLRRLRGGVRNCESGALRRFGKRRGLGGLGGLGAELPPSCRRVPS